MSSLTLTCSGDHLKLMRAEIGKSLLLRREIIRIKSAMSVLAFTIKAGYFVGSTAEATDPVLPDGTIFCSKANERSKVASQGARQHLVNVGSGGRQKILTKEAPTITRIKYQPGMPKNSITNQEAVEQKFNPPKWDR